MKKTQWLRQDNAVTEILGTMLLLLIAVAIFSTVYFSVLTISPKSPIPHANLAFTFNNENITISHLNGEPLNPKSIVIISIDNTTISQEIRNISSWDTNNDNLWGFGEKLVLQSGQTDLIDCDISLKIVDKQSNSLVFFGEYHQPSDYLPNIATEVNDISFMQSGPTLSISASGDLLLTNISLFYRYSSDNVSWTSYSKFGVDTAQPWQWIFDFPNSYGWYEFYSIGTYNSSYETPPFTADAYCAYSRAPVISDPLPTNGEINVELNKTLSINISDADGSVMDLTWYSNASGSWQQIGANNSVGNGTYYCDTAPLTSGFDTTYYWNVSVTDGTSTVESTRYQFTTLGESNPPMVPTYIYPLDKSITTLNPTLNWTCIDPEGGDLTYDVYFDTNNPPVAKLSANQSSSTFSSPAPTYGITYYWKIVAWDEEGLSTEGPVWEFTTLEWTLLTFDDFESGWGNYSDNGWDCTLYTGGVYAHQGFNAANIQRQGNGASFTYTNPKDISSPGYTSIKVDFWYRSEGVEDGEYFSLYYYDGSTWQEIERFVKDTDFENGDFYHEIVWINESDYTFSSTMYLGFKCFADHWNDDIYIDEIYVWGK